MRAPEARTLFDLVCEKAARRGADTAVVDRGETISYSELEDRARRVASALVDIGVRRGDRVGLLCDNRVEWMEIALGANACGAILVPFSTYSTRHELQFLLRDSAVKVVLLIAGLGERSFTEDFAALVPESTSAATGTWQSHELPHLEVIVAISGSTATGWHCYEHIVTRARASASFSLGEGSSENDDALILYTSGSTNRPKGVRLVNYAIIENAFNIGARQGLGPGDRVLIAPPLFWAYGSSNAMPATLTHGATMVLQSRFEAGGAIALIEQQRCTAIYTLPSMTGAMVRHPEFSPERTRTLRTGLTIGSPQDVIEGATVLGVAELCNIYGGTETYGNCCVTWHHWPLERRAACQGPPLPGVEIRCRDSETGKLVGPDTAGEVEVRGYVTPGYTGQSAAQNADLLTEDGYFRTGDIGKLTAAGDFIFIGRGDDMVKRAGINVSPVEVEDVLLQYPGIAEAGVVGVPDPERGAAVVAFVVPTREAHPTVAAILAHCRNIASSYKVPESDRVLYGIADDQYWKTQAHRTEDAGARTG